MISLIVSVVLARILLPSDYAAIALVMVFINIANVFVSNGFGNALIQKKNADRMDFSSVFYINLALSAVLYGILYTAAPWIAGFYEMPVLSRVLRVLGIRIIIASINSIQHAYVARNMLFKSFFKATLFGTVLSGIVGVWMAYFGFGVWALVVQYLVNACTDTMFLWFTVRWRPGAGYSWKRARGLFSYGWKLLLSGILDTGYNELRNLVIGKLYSPADLAYYNQGDKYPKLIVVNVNTSISSVLFPVMSHYQDKRARIKAVTRTSVQISSYIMWPFMIGMAAMAEPVIRLTLTDKWLPCVPFLRIFCISYGLWPIHTCNLQAIQALGRSDIFLKLEILKKGIGVIALVIAMKFGSEEIALSLLVTGIISVFINAAPNRRLLGYSYTEQMADLLSPFVLSLVVGVIIWPFNHCFTSDMITIAVQMAIGVPLYLSGSVLTKQKGSQIIWGILRERQMHVK